MPEELQKDPITRGQFLWMGTLGTLVTAVLTIPPAIFVLDPTIKSEIQGRSDIPSDEWFPVGSVFDIPAHIPKVYRVEFPQKQTYALQKENEGSVIEALLVSWQEGERPSIVENRSEGNLSEDEIEELQQKINVLSNHCTHLGCPVRWIEEKGEILCPCHGGFYDINGKVTGGPPPRDLYAYVFEVREDGGLWVRHQFSTGKPFVV